MKITIKLGNSTRNKARGNYLFKSSSLNIKNENTLRIIIAPLE